MPPKRKSKPQQTRGRQAKKAAAAPSRKGRPTKAKAPKRVPSPAAKDGVVQPESRDDSKVRLQRFLASTGLGSRRNCEEYILAGRVTVDGEEVRDLATTVDPGRQKITVDGETVRMQRRRYYILNKPKGYLCTNSDPSGRKRAVDLIPNSERLFTVGRLDENSQGLILVTNDGELGNRLAHPRYQIPRTYRVHVVGVPTRETLDELKKGVYFADGKFQVTGVKRVKVRGKSSVLEMQLRQGRNREIRRLLARVGHKVMSLERISFGPLYLRGLGLGKSRELKTRELQAVKALLETKPDIEADDEEVTFDQPKRRPMAKGGPRKKKARRKVTKRAGSRAAGPKAKGSRRGAVRKKAAKKRPASRKKK